MKVNNIIVAGKSGAGKQPRIDVLLSLYSLKQLSTGDIFRSCIKAYDSLDIKEDITKYNTERIIDDERAVALLMELGKDITGLSNSSEILLGLRARWYSYQGLFVPDSITNSILKHYFLLGDAKGFVLDGYPRTVPQCEFLLDLCREHNSRIDFVLLIENDDERIIKRTLGRRICPVCKAVYHIEYKPPRFGRFCNNDCAEVIQRPDDSEEKIQRRLQEFHEKTEDALTYLDKNNIPIVSVTGHLEDFSEENVRNSVVNAIKDKFGQI